MKKIVITECHDVLNITENGGVNTLSQSEADELANFIRNENIKREYISWDNKSITFINYVGYIQCSTFSIEILPKVAIHNDFIQQRNVLIEMLNESGYINVTTTSLAQLQLVNGSLLEIFGRIYASSLSSELSKGVTTKYLQIEKNLTTLKGALVISDHIKENLSRYKKYMAYCEYEEKIIDHELNQIFIAANRVLLKYINNLETQKLLKQIDHVLDGVRYKLFSKIELSRIKLDRTNKRFALPLLLAKQFLMNITSSFSANKETSFSFLFEMNDLFEKYIASLVKKLTEYTVFEQHNKYRLLVKENNNRDIFQLKPDVVIDNGEAQIIIDTKWKSLTKGNRSGVKREDLFQMYAYLTRYERAQTAILLYPKQLGIGFDEDIQHESWYLHVDEQKKLKVYSLSLENKWKTTEELKNILQINGY